MAKPTPITWTLIKEAALKGQRNHTGYRVPFTKQRLAAFLKADGWDVELEREWIGSKGRKNGRIRTSDGHDAYGWELKARKGERSYHLPAWGLFRKSLTTLIFEYEQLCKASGSQPEYAEL